MKTELRRLAVVLLTAAVAFIAASASVLVLGTSWWSRGLAIAGAVWVMYPLVRRERARAE